LNVFEIKVTLTMREALEQRGIYEELVFAVRQDVVKREWFVFAHFAPILKSLGTNPRSLRSSKTISPRRAAAFKRNSTETAHMIKAIPLKIYSSLISPLPLLAPARPASLR